MNRRKFLTSLGAFGLVSSGAIARDLSGANLNISPAQSRDIEAFRRSRMSDTDLFREAASSGEAVLSIPNKLYRIEDVIELPSGIQLLGNGEGSCLRLERARGDEAICIIATAEGSSDIVLQNFCVDGNGRDLKNPSGDQFAVVSGSAVIVSSANSLVQNVFVKNAWDNGIAVLHSRTGKGPAGVPADVRVLFSRTENCGVGYHNPGGPGQIGSGVNIGSGARCAVIGHHDRGSRGAVTVDDGGGASGFALGCISVENAGDERVGAGNPSEASRGSGTAFYSGNSDWSFDTCKAYFPRKHGFWLAAAGGMQARGCEVIGAQEHGFYLSGPNHHLSDCRAKNVSQKKDNTYSGYYVDTPFGNCDGITISDCICEFDRAAERKPRFGYQEQSLNGFLPAALITSGIMNGKTAGIAKTAGSTIVDMVISNGTPILKSAP